MARSANRSRRARVTAPRNNAIDSATRPSIQAADPRLVSAAAIDASSAGDVMLARIATAGSRTSANSS
jgi:hypothetical protein